MSVSIEICIKENHSTTDKGKILENLTSEILKIHQYNVTNNIRVTGMEIDVLAQSKINGNIILAECKAWENALPADVISKLIGNMFLRKASEGWLLTTGPLSKDAEGLRLELEAKKDNNCRISFYTSDRIVDLLIDANMVVDYKKIQSEIGGQFETSDNVVLMMTPEGKYWLIPVIDSSSEFINAIIVFNAKNGERIVDKDTLNEIKLHKNSFSNHQWLSTSVVDAKSIVALNSEYNNIVPVISGDDWTDYRPARPEDFVGRKKLLEDMFAFFESVNSGASSTRLFSIKAPSGMGKSSIVLKIGSIAKKRNMSKKFFVHAVDVRTATSPRYVEMALKSCIEKADKSGFTDIKKRDTNFASLSQFFETDSIKQTLNYLKENSKTIILIFDQFEELFSKKELYTLFDNVKALSNIIDSLQGQIILGFAWKTDLTIPAEHPAYYMWSNLADRRKEFELGQFKSSEIKSAINLFGKQLGEEINPILRNYLTKQCQGYPWLLKKLCIHVFKLINEGNSQESVIGQRLNIVDLFERDISDLSPEQHSCIKEIAQNSPADFFAVSEIYGNDMIQGLINSRLVIRRASVLTLYWDIFRDYVLNKTIPSLLLDYIPTMQFSTVASVISFLIENNGVDIETIAKSTNRNVGTIENVMIDAVMFGIGKRENGLIYATSDSEEKAIGQLQEFFKKHIMYQLMKDSSDGFTYYRYSQLFNDNYAENNFNPKTKQIYCSKLYDWFIRLGLFIEDSGKTYVIISPPKMNSLLVKKLRRNRTRFYSGTSSLFWGQASPEKMEAAFNEIENGNTSYSSLIAKKLRNPIELLSAAQAIVKNGDCIELTKDLNTVYDYIKNSDTICYTYELVRNNPNITGDEVGKKLNDKYCRNWADASIKRYGYALLRWVRYFDSKK